MTALALALLDKLKGWLLLAGGAVLAVGIAYLKGRTAGVAAQKQEQAAAQAAAISARKEIDDAVDQMGDADVDAQYNRWLRDKAER